jgi:hypothetical protein
MSTLSLLSFIYLSSLGLSIYIFPYQWLFVEYLLSTCSMGSFPGVKKQDDEADVTIKVRNVWRLTSVPPVRFYEGAVKAQGVHLPFPF